MPSSLGESVIVMELQATETFSCLGRIGTLHKTERLQMVATKDLMCVVKPDVFKRREKQK